MNYKLAKKLKDAGWKFETTNWKTDEKIKEAFFLDEPYGLGYLPPTLSELIEACGDRFGFLLLNQENGMWLARERGIEPIHPEFSGHKHYKTPEEAVANLWLELNKR